MSKIFRIILVIISITVFSGCSWFNKDDAYSIKPTELKDIENKIDFDVVAIVTVGSSSEYSYVKLAPHVLDAQVFAASRDGKVVAYDLETGNMLWKMSTDYLFSAGPYAYENLVYVGDSDANVVAFDRQTGQQQWSVILSSEILSKPIVSDDKLIIRTADGSVFALDAKTGMKKWVFDRSMPLLTLRGTSDPIISSGVVYVGLDNGKLVAIDITNGAAIWENQVAIGRGRSEVERIIDIDGTPVLQGERIYVSSYRQKLGSYSIRDGREFWSRDISSYSGLHLDNNAIFISDDSSNIWAVNSDNGASIWKQSDLVGRNTSKPNVYSSYVIIGDFEGYLHIIDKTTGEIIARVELFDSPIRQQPVVYKDFIICQSETGEIAVVKMP